MAWSHQNKSNVIITIMKKMCLTVILSTIVVAALVFILSYLINGKKLKISFMKAEKYSSEELSYNGCINNFEWIIINDSNQRRNLIEDGYSIPPVDFSKNYLIISKYKISKLYQKTGRNQCTGAPDGKVIFDKKNSNRDYYYFYLMPTVMLSQSVG